MTREEFDARYRLLSQQSNGGVETWLGLRVDTQRTVLIHKLVTSRRGGLLDMIEHLEPEERARVVDQAVVDGIPVVVTEPLPDSRPFLDWLQNSVPSNVTAFIRPLPPPADAPVLSSADNWPSLSNAPGDTGSVLDGNAEQRPSLPSVAAPPLSNRSDPKAPPAAAGPVAGSLTSLFAEEDLAAIRKAHDRKIDVPAPVPDHVEPIQPPPPPEPALVPPSPPAERPKPSGKVTPVAEASGGLTVIFAADDIRDRVASVMSERAARSQTPSSPSSPLSAPPLSAPPLSAPPLSAPSLPAPSLRSPQVSEPDEIAAPLIFNPRPTEPPPKTDDDSLPDEGIDAPAYQLGFGNEPEPRDEPARVEPPPPTLDAPFRDESSYTIIRTRRPHTPASIEPAVVTPPPPPPRKASVILVIVAPVVLILAIAGVLIAFGRSH